MSGGPYDTGDLVTISVTFKNLAGAPTDPTSLTCEVLAPSGTKTTYLWPTGSPSAVRDSVGTFHVDHLADTDGRWVYRWDGTGALTAAEEAAFSVRKKQMTP